MSEILDIEAVIAENKQRQQQFEDSYTNYDPIFGVGSPINRFTFTGLPDTTLQLPVAMKQDKLIKLIQAHGWESIARDTFSDQRPDQQHQSLLQLFHHRRCSYDFEYWSATSGHIEDNKKKLIKFVLNPPQLQSLGDLEAQRLAGKPVRSIELKHRQYGSTTMKNAYAFWLQNVVHKNMSAYICSLDQTSATKIVGRYETIINHYPPEMGELRLRPYMGLRNTYKVEGSNSRVNIGSAENPNAPSGDTIQIALISEAGKMKSTAAKGANKLITNIVSMVAMEAGTCVMIESTAEQSGEWFRRQVFKAKRGETAFNLTFISWLSDPKCYRPLESEEQERELIGSMSEYHWRLWKEGANLGHINWWILKRGEYDQDWEMMQENPAFIEEAFAGAGRKKFGAAAISNARKSVCKPTYVGEVQGKADIGPDSLKDLEFVEQPGGELKIWIHPKDYPTPKPVFGRWSCYVDIGGKHKDSDYSVIKIIDRSAILEGGVPECAAEWRGHCDPTLLAWKSAQICTWYTEGVDYPLLAVEYNALNARGNNTEGVHYLTVFNEIGKHYPNLFTRKDVSKVQNRTVTHYGFYLSYATKTMIINTLGKAWQHGGYIEHHDVTVDEASYFEIKDDNTLGAIEGEHDDSLIASGGALWLASDYMEPPRYIDPDDEFRRKETTSEAVF